MKRALACLLSCIGVACIAPSESVEKVKEFDLQDVRLLGGFAKIAQDTNTRYLLSLEPDRLLHNFRVNAGLPAPGESYGGWEAADCELRGHFVGHYLSASAMTYAATGDARLKARLDLMVSELARCQKALGGEYLSAYPTTFWDRLESLQRPPWAPYYTIHKIMAGLLDAYQLAGNRQALDVVKGMAAYFGKRVDKVPAEQWRRVLNVEFGGMNELLRNLYAVTHDPAHLALAAKFDKWVFLTPLSKGQDRLAGLHGNTHIPIVEGMARLYELTGDKKARQVTEFFWDTVVNHHSFATGGSTSGEVWGPPDKLAATLSTTNHETCKTYNMLKVTRYLFRWTADPKFADFYERAWLNGIWGTQEPVTGQLEYYVPQITGSNRTFGTADNSFWCCYGSGIENWAKAGDSVYFHDAKDLWVNLFVASQLTWKAKGLTVTQETGFPKEHSTRLVLSLKKPASFGIHIRVPAWTSPAAQLKVNGAVLKMVLEPGSYVTLRQVWRQADTIELSMPFALHVMPLPDDRDKVAVMDGPVVLAGVLGEGTARGTGQLSVRALRPSTDWVFSGDPTKPTDWLRPATDRPGEFTAVGQKQELTFKPFYEVVHERYGLYWLVVQPGGERAKRIEEAATARARLMARAVDSVTPTVDERAHNLQSRDSQAGSFGERTWRHAGPDGWFSWDLKVLPDLPMTLLCTYWGSDVGPRTFDILVDGKVLATQTVDRNKPGEFFDVEYLLPQEVTRGKSKVTLRFQPHAGSMAGGVFGATVLKP